MAYLAQADTALSVAMTSVSTLLAPTMTPLLTLWLVGERLPVDGRGMATTIVQTPAEAAHRAGLRELPFRERHAVTMSQFPQLARHDPFDRMLLAQAQAEDLMLLTSDRVLLGLGHDWVVDARG